MERSLIGILGASGKVGQLVCDYLVRNTGYIVKAGYRKTIPFLFNGRLRWQFVDIQDKQKLFEFCRVSAKYCYITHELRLHQNDRCKRFTPV